MQPQPQHPWTGSASPAGHGPTDGFWNQITALPNLLTMARVLSIPAIGLCLHREAPFYEGVALALIVVALSTDFLDGYVARRQGIKTQLGLILDPTADKLLISSLAIMGVVYRELPPWMGGIIVGKDLAVFLGAAIIYRRRGLVFPADRWGRVTTAVSSAAVILYFVLPPPYALYAAGTAVCCIGIAGSAYLRRFMSLLHASGPDGLPS